MNTLGDGRWRGRGGRGDDKVSTVYDSRAAAVERSVEGWWRTIVAVMYWGLVMKDWPATSVAPAVIQFLAVAGEVTEVAP